MTENKIFYIIKILWSGDLYFLTMKMKGLVFHIRTFNRCHKSLIMSDKGVLNDVSDDNVIVKERKI